MTKEETLADVKHRYKHNLISHNEAIWLLAKAGFTMWEIDQMDWI